MSDVLLMRDPGVMDTKILGRWVHVMGASDRTAESKIRGLSLAGEVASQSRRGRGGGRLGSARAARG